MARNSVVGCTVYGCEIVLGFSNEQKKNPNLQQQQHTHSPQEGANILDKLIPDHMINRFQHQMPKNLVSRTLPQVAQVRPRKHFLDKDDMKAVSYTHLTLPTKLAV